VGALKIFEKGLGEGGEGGEVVRGGRKKQNFRKENDLNWVGVIGFVGVRGGERGVGKSRGKE